jgi:hypothetical protein
MGGESLYNDQMLVIQPELEVSAVQVEAVGLLTTSVDSVEAPQAITHIGVGEPCRNATWIWRDANVLM